MSDTLTHGGTAVDEPQRASGALLFISDLHLSPTLPRTVAAFERFIDATVAREGAQAVYILGDLFEIWIGDDMLSTPFAARMARTLHTLSERGITLYVMHGNRDFLLGAHFAKRAGAVLLTDPFMLDAFGRRVLLMHGDSLCTNEVGYQRFRAVVRHPAVQRFFLSWPFAWRLALARKLRRNSARTGAERMAISDVAGLAVRQALAHAGTETMIHGHTHRPACHQGDGLTRWVLTDWDLDSARPRAGYLRLDADGIQAIAVTAVEYE